MFQKKYKITWSDKLAYSVGLITTDSSLSLIYKNSLRPYAVFLSASLLHILWLQAKIKELAGRNSFLRKSSGVHSWTFSKYDSIRLLQRLYYKKNLPCLKRRFLIAKDFLNMPR